MNKVCGKLVLGAGILAGLGAAPSSQASEPDDQAPFASFYGNVPFMQLKDQGAIGTNNPSDGIQPLGDIDYYVLSCAMRKMNGIYVDYKHADGDVDMQVFDTLGNLLAVSDGVVNNEKVNVVSRNKQIVILKVYGWGATNPKYDISFNCVP